jgi:hypothetical protein
LNRSAFSSAIIVLIAQIRNWRVLAITQDQVSDRTLIAAHFDTQRAVA